MSIWYYDQQRRPTPADQEMALLTDCIFCGLPIRRDTEDEQDISAYEALNYGMSDGFRTLAHAVIGICPACGWWKYSVETILTRFGPQELEPIRDIKFGSLKCLDLMDVGIPLADVRDYLIAKYDARFAIHPRIFEEVVASVFRDHGFEATATAYSGDGGIDVVLADEAGHTVGVQVKRYKNTINVDQIRELTGALVIAGHTKGIFVTTSKFASGASDTARRSEFRGYPIELVDAPQFYQKLMAAQLSSIRELASLKPWGVVMKWDS